MVRNDVEFNGRRESPCCAAENEEYDKIPVREVNGFKRHKRIASAEVAKRTSYDRSNDLLTLHKEYEARRWYETKAVRDLVQTVSFYNDHDGDNDYDEDDEWRHSCPSPEDDSQENEQRDYDEEIDVNIEDIPEKENDSRVMLRSKGVNTDSSDGEIREPCLFSFDYFKMKWKKFRDLIDYCYPALARNKEYYKCPFPCSPSGVQLGEQTPEDDRDDFADDHGDHDDLGENQPADDGEQEDHGFGGNVEAPGIPPSLTDPIESPVPTPSPEDRESESEKYGEGPRVRLRSAGVYREAFEQLDDDQQTDGNSQQAVVKPCCADDDFWTTLLQILILAPLLAFTAYLFVQWYKARREYKEKLEMLNQLKRENENLVGAINRLDAFVMSCQMSPIVCVKRQCKLEDHVRRICQSLKNHKEKIKELEQDRAIYREVLWNLKTCA